LILVPAGLYVFLIPYWYIINHYLIYDVLHYDYALSVSAKVKNIFE